MSSDLRVCHLNVRSLLPKIDDIRAYCAQCSVDIFCLSETWLADTDPEVSLQINNYSLLRKDRAGNDYGGVAIYLKKNLKYVIIPSDEPIEQLWVRIDVNSRKKIAVGVVYNPHRRHYRTFLDALLDSVSLIFPTCDELVCVGDLNIDVLDQLSPEARKFETFCDTFGLTQVIDVATRGDGLIDHVIVSDSNFVKNVTVSPFLSSHSLDHDMVAVDLAVSRQPPSVLYRAVRDFRSSSVECFRECLAVAPLHRIFSMEDVNDKVGFFNHTLLGLYNCYFPLRQVRITKPPAPWMTDNLKFLMNLRDNAHSRWRRTRAEGHFKYYKTLRNQTTLLCRLEKKNYYQYCVDSGNMKSIWKDFNASSRYQIPDSLSDPNSLNEFYTNISPCVPDWRLMSYYKENVVNGVEVPFRFEFVSADTVRTLLYAVKTESVGYDGIGINMLRHCGDLIIPYLTHIVNCCIESNTFPGNWKTAIVKPIPKIPDPKEMKDLRPISILPVLSKILERVMCEQLRTYLDQHHILPSEQSGFRPFHSCGSALLNIKDDILRAKDAGLITALVLFDFSKAFDTINHSMLLAICKHVGFSSGACELLTSYLEDRRQMVQISGSMSSLERVSSGVPQGSILGPLLYTLYTFALPKCLSFCSVHLYADDTQIYSSFAPSSVEMAVNNINRDIKSLLEYARSHCLNLNHAKTKLLLFGPQKTVDTLSRDFVLDVCGTTIKVVPEARNLGVVFDSALRFRTHISECLRSSYHKLKLIYSKRHSLDRRLKSTLCEALVLSRLNFCDIVYGPSLDSRDVRRIQVLQNSCLRLIYGVRRRQHISDKLKINRWLNMSDRRYLHLAVFFHKLLLHRSPPYLLNKITYRSDVHNINVRFRGSVSIPAHKTEAFKRSFSYQIARIYNPLSNDLKKKSLMSFKKHLRTELLAKL